MISGAFMSLIIVDGGVNSNGSSECYMDNEGFVHMKFVLFVAICFIITTTQCLADNKMDTESLAYLTPLAKQGDAKSQYLLGKMHYMGELVAPDMVKAIHWNTESALQGHAEAQYLLGKIYSHSGPYGTPDYEQAIYWHKKAAQQGHAAAQFRLGTLYSGDKDGVKPDYSQSEMWMQKSADQGFEAAIKALPSLTRHREAIESSNELLARVKKITGSRNHNNFENKPEVSKAELKDVKSSLAKLCDAETKQNSIIPCYSDEVLKDYLATVLFENSKLIIYPKGPITYRISDPEKLLTPSQHKIIGRVLEELTQASGKRFVKKSSHKKANLVLYFTDEMKAFSKSYSFHSMIARDLYSRIGKKLSTTDREKMENRYAETTMFSFSIPDKEHNEFIADGYVVTDLSNISEYSLKKELLKQIGMVLIRGRHFYKKKESPVPTIFSSVSGKYNVDDLSTVDRAFLQVIYSGEIAAGTNGFTARNRIKDLMLKLMPDVEPVVNVSNRPSNYNFPLKQKLQNDDGELQAVLYDFMLAKYVPEKLDQKMLEAMFSSRWVYEAQQIEPFGGHFFKKGSATPTYTDVKNLTDPFRKWLTAGAKKLSDNYTLEIPLFYANKTVTSGSICFKLGQPVNAPVRGSQLNQAQKISMCKNSNARAVNLFNQCEEAYLDIEKAKGMLAREKKNGCKPVGRPPHSASTEGPCNFPKDMKSANIKQEIKKCMADNCDSITATIEGMQSYQSCVKLLSDDMTVQLQTLMKPAGKGSAQAGNVDTCTPQKNNITTYRKRINRYQCDLHSVRPEAVDCGALADNETQSMRVIRLDIANNKKCDNTWVFNRATKRSAILLNKGRPNPSSTLDLSFVIDDLNIPYTAPFRVSNKIPNAKSTVHLNVLGINEKNSNPQKISLNSKVISVSFKAFGN